MINKRKILSLFLLGTTSMMIAGGGLDFSSGAAPFSTESREDLEKKALVMQRAHKIYQEYSDYVCHTTDASPLAQEMKQDPIYRALRKANSKYNSMDLTSCYNYETNISILNKESTQLALRNATDNVVDKFMPHDDANFTQDVKDTFYTFTFKRLLEEQEHCLKMAREGQIYTV